MRNRNKRQDLTSQPKEQSWGNYPQQGYQNYNSKQYPAQKRKKRKRSFGFQIFKLLLVLILVGGIGAGIYIGKTYLDVLPYANVFLDGVIVDGIDLGGMTWDEGEEAVRNQIVEELSSWYVRLKSTSGSYHDITAETLGISSDPSDALEQAWAVGHQTDEDGRITIFDLQSEIQAAQAGNYIFSSVDYDADTTVIDEILEILEEAAYIEAEDARMLEFDPDSTTEPFIFQEEVIGRELDTESLKEQIIAMVESFESGEILVEADYVYPEITVDDLQQYYTLRARAVTPIASSSSDERNENIEIAFSKINGYIVNDGSKFSFNDVVGKRTTANGFLRAYEYSYGELVWGVGGGVCQASTTVYLAAMKAGLELVDHTAHSQKVSYTDLGLDATVSDTTGREKDMSFRNNSGGQIFISAQLITYNSTMMCEVRIYGIDLGDTSYDLETEIVEVLEPDSEPTIVEDTEFKYVTYTDEYEIVTEAAEGYVVDTYRVTYENDVEVDREKLVRSTYAARDEVMYIGTITR